jgi:DNA-binding CsgD family transcriptional regulator
MKDKIIKLIEDGLTYDDISRKLGCSKSTISYHCNKLKIVSKSKNIDVDDNLVNKINELYKSGNSSYAISKILGISKSTALKYISRENIRAKIKTKTKKDRSKYMIYWKRNLKKSLVDYKGSKCEICGYDKCIEALEFHHLDPTKKDFSISTKLFGIEKMKKEVDKCLMVCSNCHRELHYLSP